MNDKTVVNYEEELARTGYDAWPVENEYDDRFGNPKSEFVAWDHLDGFLEWWTVGAGPHLHSGTEGEIVKARVIAARTLSDALASVEAMFNDLRELYTADEAIDRIRAWARERGIAVKVPQ